MIVRAPSDKSDFEDKLVIDNWGQEIINNITKDAYHGERVMRTVTDQKYLGIILNNEGSHTKTIKDKLNKAKGKKRRILDKLSNMWLGE